MSETFDEEGARDPYYIRTSPVATDLPRLVVKCDDAFFVADHHGDFPELPDSEFGFYVGGTRYLRSLELWVHGQRPLPLNAAVSDDGRQVSVDLTNPDLSHGEIVVLKGRLIRLARRLTLAPTGLSDCRLPRHGEGSMTSATAAASAASTSGQRRRGAAAAQRPVQRPSRSRRPRPGAPSGASSGIT